MARLISMNKPIPPHVVDEYNRLTNLKIQKDGKKEEA